MLVVVVIAACATPPLVDAPDGELPAPTNEAGEPLPSAGTATLRANTVVLPASISKHAVSGLGDVMFPAAGNEALLELARGDVIVSGTGDGFIRRVYAVEREDAAIRIITSVATLADAVSEATFQMAVSEPLAIGTHLDGRTETLTAMIDGDLAITPVIDLGFALDADGLRSFDLQVSGTGSTTVEGTVEFTATTHWAWGAERQYATPLFRRAYALGPLPLVVVGRMTTTLGASAFVEEPVAFTSGAHVELAIESSSSYGPQTGWTMTDASQIEVSQLGPIHTGQGRASLAITIDPRIELAFYGASGTELHLVTQAGAFGAYCGPTLLTGLQAAVHGSVAFKLAPLVKSTRADVTLWDKRQFLDELEACAP